MSCGEPHETDCSEVLDHLYEYLDREMPDSDCEKFKEHFDECSPCLEKYGLEQEVKKLVKRCCGHDDVPSGLRSKVMGRIELIRAAEAAGTEVPVGPDESQTDAKAETKPEAKAEVKPDGNADAVPADTSSEQPSGPASQSVSGRSKYA
ncbi:mycothiol system anti-sigma-R factor [Streptomyces sp. HNM0575]|uniref:mycothiol system anti-sigma-R factor n=1 Tax=Streptomyces sp. HNM0575 TaxID=2716338 RepID=UPI00145DA715|nr:mycothiol system anti-sigma-R factor [Streptomyces sp. HNM0575]NLU72031.1 mycothiol system anti-sigma-R factor [Streptomyces sp. HNM0575]